MEFQNLYHLQPGTKLQNRYTIKRELGSGGFGITYCAIDEKLQLQVAIKEYFPDRWVIRNVAASCKVSLKSEKYQSKYEHLKGELLKEAKILARFDNLVHVVRVRDHFEENETAYIVMEYLNGATLKDHVENIGTFDPEKLSNMMLPMIRALDIVHQKNLIHRDISPDNIMLMENQQLKLLDFGAARAYQEETDKGLSVILKEGFAPSEQYMRHGKQGPWTDIYALCATMYYCITATVPESSMDRNGGVTLQKPSELGIIIKPSIEAVLMKGLNLKIGERYQSAAEMADALEKALLHNGGNIRTVLEETPQDELSADASPAQIKAEEESVPESSANQMNSQHHTSGHETSSSVVDVPKRANRMARVIATVAILVVCIIGCFFAIGIVIPPPVPATPTPAFVTPTLVQVTATPVPVTATPVPVTATPVPVTATPVPVTATPVPVTTTPVPVTATSVSPTHVDINVFADKTIIFGSYEQDNNLANGAEPIEWMILDAADGIATLISVYGLDCLSYHSASAEVEWNDCTLRLWLNNEFVDSAFQKAEKKMLIANERTDKVWILNTKEAQAFFADDISRMATPTDYALSKGAFVAKKNGCCWWWLMSEQKEYSAPSVASEGMILTQSSNVSRNSNAVRPVIKVHLSMIGE